MAMLNSYVTLPEGNPNLILRSVGSISTLVDFDQQRIGQCLSFTVKNPSIIPLNPCWFIGIPPDDSNPQVMSRVVTIV